MRLGPAAERAHVVTTAAVVVLVVADPLRGMRLGDDWATWVTGQQRLDGIMSPIAPPLFVSTVVAALAGAAVAAGQHQPLRSGLRAAAAGCVAAAVVATLRLNEPVNERLRRWDAAGPAAPDWREARARWERGHAVRRALLAVAAAATAAGLVTDR